MTTDVGVGLDVAFGFALEPTARTRQTPDTFCYITQESLSRNQGFIRNPGLGGGRQIQRSKKNGAYNPGGDVSMVFGTAEAANVSASSRPRPCRRSFRTVVGLSRSISLAVTARQRLSTSRQASSCRCVPRRSRTTRSPTRALRRSRRPPTSSSCASRTSP